MHIPSSWKLIRTDHSWCVTYSQRKVSKMKTFSDTTPSNGWGIQQARTTSIVCLHILIGIGWNVSVMKGGKRSIKFIRSVSSLGWIVDFLILNYFLFCCFCVVIFHSTLLSTVYTNWCLTVPLLKLTDELTCIAFPCSMEKQPLHSDPTKTN